MAHLFFSIVVVSLNPGEKLVPTLKSVLDQDYGNFEIIIKDGGSTDGSVEKLEELPADSRIRFFREPDKGIYDGMNQALAHARGRFLLFLNCGDRLYSRSVLSETAEFIEKTEKESLCRTRPYIFYGDQYNELQDCPVHSAPRMNDFACYRNVPCHQSASMTPACLRSGDMIRISGCGRIMSISCTVFMTGRRRLCICR